MSCRPEILDASKFSPHPRLNRFPRNHIAHGSGSVPYPAVINPRPVSVTRAILWLTGYCNYLANQWQSRFNRNPSVIGSHNHFSYGISHTLHYLTLPFRPQPRFYATKSAKKIALVSSIVKPSSLTIESTSFIVKSSLFDNLR